MNQQAIADELDRQVKELLRGKRKANASADPLLALAAELQILPVPEFKTRLGEELAETSVENAKNFHQHQNIDAVRDPASVAEMKAVTAERLEALPASFAGITPLFDGNHTGLFPADHRSFVVSFISHAALIALIASGIFVGHVAIVRPIFLTSELTYPPPAGHGGGGSGDHSAIRATRGTPPKFSEQQVTPPIIVVPNEKHKLTVDASVLGPPQITLPESNRIGDLISTNIVIPSNGTGVGGGAGDGRGTGLGRGGGAGVGAGKDWGYGGGSPSRLGITAPRAIYDPEPEYSEEARKVKHQGIVVLALVVDAEGHARDIRVARSLGMGLDEKAIEAVKKWKFAPGTSNGVAVSMQVNVEVNFRLF